MDERLYIRQTGIIDPEKLTHRIAIVGAGSIGGWTALCLGKLGCRDITVLDFDEVEIHNAGSQVFKAADAGEKKVDALKFRLDFLLENPIETHYVKWTPAIDLRTFDIVIAAVDNITVRKQIFEQLHGPTIEVGRSVLYIDARMASNAIEIYTVHCNVPEEGLAYMDTLFEESETRPIPCSERAVVYNVFRVAGMIGNIVAKHANGQELPREIIEDLYNLTLYT